MAQTKKEKLIQMALKRKHKVGDTVLLFKGNKLVEGKVTSVEEITKKKFPKTSREFTFVDTDTGVSGGVEHFIKKTGKSGTFKRVEKGIIIQVK